MTKMTKKIDKIRECKDTMYIAQALSSIEGVRRRFCIPKNENIYILESDYSWYCFLYKDTLIIQDIGFPHRYIYTVKMLCTTPKTAYDLQINIIKEEEPENDLAEEVLAFLNSPCIITEMVDVSNLEVIRFLQQYKETTFKTDRYQFYVKRDDDHSWSFNIYAKDLKLNNELKIYVEMDVLRTVMPKNSRDVLIYDKSGNMTKYQISKCKKAFMDFIQGECPQLKVNNFFALELIKQAIQPVEQDWGRFVSIPFSYKDTGFAEISVDDFPVFDEKPYFMLALNESKDRKTAVLDFLEPRYKTTGIYKNGHNKTNFWKLSQDEITALMKFLNAPCSEKMEKRISANIKLFFQYRKCENVKMPENVYTNWQYLIYWYNENTGELHGEVVLPDTPMPDYTKL